MIIIYYAFFNLCVYIKMCMSALTFKSYKWLSVGVAYKYLR